MRRETVWGLSCWDEEEEEEKLNLWRLLDVMSYHGERSSWDLVSSTYRYFKFLR